MNGCVNKTVMTHYSGGATSCTHILCTYGHAQQEDYTLNKSAMIGENSGVHMNIYVGTWLSDSKPFWHERDFPFSDYMLCFMFVRFRVSYCHNMVDIEYSKYIFIIVLSPKHKNCCVFVNLSIEGVGHLSPPCCTAMFV